ncbi:MAG: hypothetical protein EPO52_09820 [Herbiconiux sp.]|uniref:hypothetical protein n=1 Tax=Herbiconiux sp. TaxID=1871186 RepID=UPI00121522F7|nr:hypothetical protein [Herbiconiux sp.]TAJ48423.1 MAG: hypothetical protein EPO52_09820 [Herbiconiux sp.]
MTNPQEAAGQRAGSPAPRFRLLPRARRGARLAGVGEGVVLGVFPLAIGVSYLADGNYSDATMISLGIIALGTLIAAWVVPYFLARTYRVGRAGAVTWASLAITTGAAIVTGAIATAAAVAAVLFGVIVTWSGLLYQPSIVVAVVVTILIPVLVGALVTPALARVLNARQAERIVHSEGAAEQVWHSAAASAGSSADIPSPTAPALEAPSAEIPPIRI